MLFQALFGERASGASRALYLEALSQGLDYFEASFGGALTSIRSDTTRR